MQYLCTRHLKKKHTTKVIVQTSIQFNVVLLQTLQPSSLKKNQTVAAP